MSFILPELPFKTNALEPHMSKQTVEYHYGKHTRKYFDTANELIRGTTFESATTLAELITNPSQLKMDSVLFNNAAQAWNHLFFWEGLTPKKTTISDELRAQIIRDFGSVDRFKDDFCDNAIKHFASGWVWVIYKQGKLSIKTTANAGTPLTTKNEIPLLVCDVWEHSYYLDYPADRAGYVKAWWNVIDWEKVSERYKTEKY